ncbi:MAG: PhzF family phenazine biosynthesis protein [Desulfobacteraceae bacterium]|nr:PhzF family phenazine biosynthesis protein [Desulfobacteraceae bacterium]
MKSYRFFILDVFAEKKYAGNQLAVFSDASTLSTEEMQAIAGETNFSETTFILSRTPRDGGYDVRIFTPRHEVPFAGHPTLGTAYILQQEIIGSPVEQVILNLKIGKIPVDITYQDGIPDTLWMKQIQPEFGAELPAEAVMNMLGLESGAWDKHFPVQSVSTGLPMFMVPITTLENLRRIRVNTEAYYRLIKDQTAKAFYVFCPETYHAKNHLSARMFGDYYGVPEDPATGSAAGSLAGYLTRHRYLNADTISVRLEQGYEMGRPSLLLLNTKSHDEHIDIRVGGQVVKVAEGTFL